MKTQASFRGQAFANPERKRNFMDELEKLFAEASASVKKVTSAPSAPAPARTEEPPPPPVAAPEPVVEAELAPPQPVMAPPKPAPVAQPVAPGGPIHLPGGQQSANGFVVQSPNGPVEIAWNRIESLHLGRAENRQFLAFRFNRNLFFFRDDNVAYKGLLSQMQPSATANWRGLIVEFAEKTGKGDDGVQAVTSGGGVVPKFNTAQEFFAKL